MSLLIWEFGRAWEAPEYEVCEDCEDCETGSAFPRLGPGGGCGKLGGVDVESEIGDRLG